MGNEDTVRRLFGAFMERPESMPGPYAAAARDADETTVARLVADYISGMTDRYAIAEQQRVATLAPAGG